MRALGARGLSALVVVGVMGTALLAHAKPKSRALGVTIVGTKGRVTSSTPIKLSSRVRWRGPKATMSYSWTEISGPGLPGGVDTDAKTLVIPKGTLDAGADYHLRLKITAEFETEDGHETLNATGDVKFAVNAPPRGGSCTLETRFVGFAGAAVVIAAPDWVDDDDKRLQYRYSIVRNGKRPFVLKNWSSRTKLAANSVARPGDVLVAKCDVRDPLGDMVTAKSEQHRRPQ